MIMTAGPRRCRVFFHPSSLRTQLRLLVTVSFFMACLFSLLLLLPLWFENARLSPGMGVTTVGPTHTNKKASSQSSGSGSEQNNAHQHNHRRTFYSTLRSDRMGAVVQDMLVAHAHAFQRGLVYAGACPPPSDLNHVANGSFVTTNVSAADVTAVLRALGLQALLPVACPPSSDAAPPPIVDRSFYTRQGLQACTPEWQRFVQSAREREIMMERDRENNNTSGAQPDATNNHSSSPRRGRRPRAVVHIRRGDVTPCTPNTDVAKRYLPNSYYQRVVREYVPSDHSIVVYSESESFEPWSDFHTTAPTNWELRLDSDRIDAWIDMIEATDLLILSKSSFSLVPALLHQNSDGGDAVGASVAAKVVVCPDQWMADPLPLGWTGVPPAWHRDAEYDIQRLRQERCPT